MVNYTPDALDATFSALSDPTRRAILARLSRGGATVGELAKPFAMSLPAVSKHIRVLEGAGLLARRRDGRIHRIGIEVRPLRDAADWLERYRRFWEERLDALAEYLEETRPEEEDPWPHPKRSRTSRSGSSGPTRRPGSGSSRRGPKRNR